MRLWRLARVISGECTAIPALHTYLLFAFPEYYVDGLLTLRRQWQWPNWGVVVVGQVFGLASRFCTFPSGLQGELQMWLEIHQKHQERYFIGCPIDELAADSFWAVRPLGCPTVI